MSSYKFLVFLFVVIFVAILVISCAPVTKYYKIVDYSVDPPDKATQTKQGVTIKMKYLDQNEIKNNRLFTRRVLSKGLLTTNVSELSTKDVYVNPFANQLAFEVIVENNTDHILRMKDARVVYVENKSMEGPLRALDKNMMSNGVEDHPKVLYYRTKNDPVDDAIADSWVAALQKIYLSDKLKIINDVGMEIFPHYSASGLLVFPVTPERAIGGQVSFIDITTKVDNAGNPIEKEHYDFKIKAKEHYFRTLGKESIEITREDYNTQRK